MPFVCSLCGIEIGVGEPMVPNIRMEVAHDRCVQKEGLLRGPEDPSEVIIGMVPDPKKIDIAIKIVSSSFGFGNPTASFEPCLLPSAPKVCAICDRGCISQCPYCKQMICHTYGWDGRTCSLTHETTCAGARQSREPLEKPPSNVSYGHSATELFTELFGKKNGNGKHKSKKKGSKR